MPDATFVAFVPHHRTSELRSILKSEDTHPLTWKERRSWFGSEFFFSGPPTLARKAQEYVGTWLKTPTS
jgi:hypothetical protein